MHDHMHSESMNMPAGAQAAIRSLPEQPDAVGCSSTECASIHINPSLNSNKHPNTHYCTIRCRWYHISTCLHVSLQGLCLQNRMFLLDPPENCLIRVAGHGQLYSSMDCACRSLELWQARDTRPKVGIDASQNLMSLLHCLIGYILPRGKAVVVLRSIAIRI